MKQKACFVSSGVGRVGGALQPPNAAPPSPAFESQRKGRCS